ncbi:2-dehydro-3-deoxyphosphooctonate aldolase [Magnetococcus marinus MC-1]|uniref:2-dehydro-3-deoxyphosphooctonate aldolase n=1 Tax=Magnetococcus marinus (strain ATCC BAA-1437 / JCM 17883 / MC-1) TaxID=156889 RepID=KDSA_MAGMM|nr:3-deoxy-8-phosphooctulonate synthase [Magnetococcus marinus]A0L7X4.1 RecName: Full=2-dehydro-3-deoxyphosphooctonate aldolase; AltName: Full=3-deoxy-D-manno-octulosonic acid 8-phosphate synthase; AltName: Full=KDO-8-phosphate synthase; Short=KDO 8-P synthase; Short=KDOPS; AltName: Full=Phospho-2-dehydro-3-deoxyoctonate aldolase [Magnetococcus marinus MC-1]ABK44067.1 2-dehydro-3-deoxyphosphooctonate aldolase [Magnetococcus marinus MC-1]
MTPRTITVDTVRFGNHLPMTLIAGPCVIEGLEFALRTAEALKQICEGVGVELVYKSSFDKANRTSEGSFRGPGMEAGLRILERVRREVGVPVITDVHEADQCVAVAEVVDMLQTPAFLCRQTDFIQAAARPGKPVNIKKGQFLAPQDMARVAAKAAATGNENILLCERGFSFGYQNLVVDMRGLSIMAQSGYPVIFDATHSVQQPGALGGASGGDRRFVSDLARAAVAVGVAGVFMEVHPDPDHAPCDGPNMLPMAHLSPLLDQLKALDRIRKEAMALESGLSLGDA